MPRSMRPGDEVVYVNGVLTTEAVTTAKLYENPTLDVRKRMLEKAEEMKAQKMAEWKAKSQPETP